LKNTISFLGFEYDINSIIGFQRVKISTYKPRANSARKYFLFAFAFAAILQKKKEGIERISPRQKKANSNEVMFP